MYYFEIIQQASLFPLYKIIVWKYESIDNGLSRDKLIMNGKSYKKVVTIHNQKKHEINQHIEKYLV